MMMLMAAVAGLMMQAGEPAWTWSLYEGEGPVVLANDVPDTARLRATLECEAGQGAARVTAYGSAAPAVAGMATLRSGSASAAAEGLAGRDGRLSATVRTEHPVFAAFVDTGRLTLTMGPTERVVAVQAEHLAKLRRFAELCGG